jgi:hypothetical protein
MNFFKKIKEPTILVKYDPIDVLFKRDEVVKFVYSDFTQKKL